jgi:hypothetical protein
MSRGPGRIERAIRALFDAHPDEAFVTDELCEHCYPEVRPIERKHQVAVLRAAKQVIEHDPDWTAWQIGKQGNAWVFCNRDSVTSRACARGIAGHIYRSEKRGARKKYDWVRVPGARMRRPHGADVIAFHQSRGLPIDPTIYEQRVWQRDDLRLWLGSERGQKACAAVEGDVAWHRALRDADDTRRQVLLGFEDAIRQRFDVWREWQKAKATWASKPEVWLKRFAAAVGQRQRNTYEGATVTVRPDVLSQLADRLRAQLTQNDPDAMRWAVREIAATLDELGRREAPTLDADDVLVVTAPATPP